MWGMPKVPEGLLLILFLRPALPIRCYTDLEATQVLQLNFFWPVSAKQKGNDFCLTKMEMRFFVIPLSFQNLPCIVAMAPHEMGSQVGVEVRNEPPMSNIYLLGKRLGVTLSQDNKIWMKWKQRHILHSWGIWSLR